MFVSTNGNFYLVFSCSNVLLTAFAIFKYATGMLQRDIERDAGRKHNTKRLRRTH